MEVRNVVGHKDIETTAKYDAHGNLDVWSSLITACSSGF
jgi:hypothetical protein